MTNEARRLRWLDILKFLGIASVVFGHIYTGQAAVNWLYTFHVPLFFAVGGVVFRPREILADIRRRAYRILVPYAVFGIVILLYYFFLERRFRDIDVGLAEGFLGLLTGSIDSLSFHSHLWFLPCYFLTSVLYNILYRLVKPAACRIICGAACVAYVLLPIPVLPWGADRAPGFLGLFALGNIAADTGLTERAEKLSIPVKLISAALLTGASIALSLTGLTSGIMWIVCAVVETAGFAFLALALDKLSLPARFMADIGKMTLVILCIHGPIYRVLLKLASMAFSMPTDALRENPGASALIAALAIAICCGIYKLLERLLPWCIGITPKKKTKTAPQARERKDISNG